MRVTAEHRTALAQRIATLDTEATRDAYRAGRFPRAELVKDLDKRYRWDLLHAAKVWDVLDAGYSDAHLDTALRSIVAPL